MKTHRYFPGLNTLRFYAAFSVLIFHVSAYPLAWFDFPARTVPLEWVLLNGWDGVTVFFVLSGFLITYLLLTEINNTGSINLRKFYTRRALRIWPIYYLFLAISTILVMLILGNPFAIVTRENTLAFGFIMFFMPNIASAFFPAGLESVTTFITHFWSIGVEEQFYFAWPFLIKKRWRFLKRFLIIFFAIKWSLSTILFVLLIGYEQKGLVLEVLNVLDQARFECIAIGAAGAYLVFTNHRWLTLIYRPRIERLAIAFLALVIVFSEIHSTFYDLMVALAFIVVILNVATNPRATLKLENKLFYELGQISYGIYVYHSIVIFLTIVALKQFGIMNGDGLIYDLPVYSISSIATIIIAYLSYHYFEKPFLRFKERFAVLSPQAETPVSP